GRGRAGRGRAGRGAGATRCDAVGMTELTIAAPRARLPVYLAVPDGPGPWPGVVVIHDGMGMGRDVRNQADWLAGHGYLAAAPDPFRGRAKISCMISIMREARARTGPTFDDIDAAREWLARREDCTASIGVIGYCMGGRLALLLAPDHGFAASSVNYGVTARAKEGLTRNFLRPPRPLLATS